MYKNIVPNLVSFDTDLNEINGLNFSEQLDFYTEIRTPNKFHYKVAIDNNIVLPTVYDFKNGYLEKQENCWYYQRKFFGLEFKFLYNEESKTFLFNKNYIYVPIEFGHLFPVGRHLRDLIDLELFLNNFITIIGGCTVHYKGKNITVVGPSMNGKTSFLKSIIQKGGKYISEGPVIIDYKNNATFPCSNLERRGRKVSRELYKIIDKENPLTASKVKIDKLYVIINRTNSTFEPKNKDFFDFIIFRSLFFMKNPFTSSYIFKNNLTNKIINKINRLKSDLKINYEYLTTDNYDFQQIIQNNDK